MHAQPTDRPREAEPAGAAMTVEMEMMHMNECSSGQMLDDDDDDVGVIT